MSRAGSTAVPGNVSATALSSTVISVQWSGLSHCRLVNGLIVKYRVQWRSQESGELVESTKEVSGNWSSGGETALTGLTPSTNYSISVAGINQQGDVGVYSQHVTVRTLPGSYLHTNLKWCSLSHVEGQDLSHLIVGVVVGFSGILIAVIGILVVCSVCMR